MPPSQTIEEKTPAAATAAAPIRARTQGAAPELSVVIPTFNEEGNIGRVVDRVAGVCRRLGVRHEVVVVDGRSRDRTAEEALRAGAAVLEQRTAGYGAALREGFQAARGEHILTMDSDLSHPPEAIRALLAARGRGDIIIASRYVKGGHVAMPWGRIVLSRILNLVFRRALDLPARDLSSGFRLYRRKVLEETRTAQRDFSFAQEVLAGAYSAGFSIHEVPFHYFPRSRGSSKARIFRFGLSYLGLLWRCFWMRRSPACADHEERAFDSWFLPRRWASRRRYRIITGFLEPDGRAPDGRVLDLDPASSRVFEALPGAVGLDPDLKRLRHRRALGNPLVRGGALRLPFRDRSFARVIASGTFDRAAPGSALLAEVHRLVEAGGTLVLRSGAPRSVLGGLLESHGFEWLEDRKASPRETIVKARKR